jgi:polysaccharide biosynthesis transport protein
VIEEESKEIGVKDVLRILRQQIWLILAVMALAVVAAVASNLRVPTEYQATSEVLVRGVSSQLDPDQRPVADPERSLRNEVRFARSSRVRAATVDKLGPMNFFQVDVSGSNDTDVLTFTAKAREADVVAQVANTYAEAYLEQKQQSVQEEFTRARAIFENRIDETSRTIEALGFEAQQEREVLDGQRREYRRKLEQLQLRLDLVSASPGEITRTAFPPTRPSQPQPTRDLGVALLAGLVLGSGIAFVREFLDDSVSTADELAQAVVGVPQLAMIPRARRSDSDLEVASISDKDSPVAEAFRSLRTSLSFISFDSDMRAVQITSAIPGEGKTTTVANLAVALARAGELVVVVDADLRRPRLHELFGIENELGLGNVLSGTASLPEVVKPIRGEDFELFFVPAGPVPPNASELLSSPRLPDIVKTLRGDADIVLFDSTPLLPVSDGLVLARALDASILVARAKVTNKGEARRATKELEQVGASLVGTVLLDADEDQAGSTYAGYERRMPRRRLSDLWPKMSKPSAPARKAPRATAQTAPPTQAQHQGQAPVETF